MTAAFTVLIAEDDDGHATLIQRNLQRSVEGTQTVRVRDGQEVLDYLRRRAPWTDRSVHPAIAVVLDLNMPRLGGFDVLSTLKHDPGLQHIPLFVLTTTDDQVELERCYAYGASACLVKPVDYGAFGEMVRHLANFLAAASMPPENPATAHAV